MNPHLMFKMLSQSETERLQKLRQHEGEAQRRERNTAAVATVQALARKKAPFKRDTTKMARAYMRRDTMRSLEGKKRY